MWQHNYEPIAGSLGASTPVAAIPIVVLFVMLGVLRKPAWVSAATALGSAFLVSALAYGMPVKLALLATVYGAAYGLFPIAWIVFASIMLYRLAVDTGKFEILKDSVGTLTDDRRLQAMFIAFSFGAFIEGAAGFGAPVAISGAMLAGLGFDPFYAAGICLLANTAPGRLRIDRHPGDNAGQRHGTPRACAERNGRPSLRDDFRVDSRLFAGGHGRDRPAPSKCCPRSLPAACRSPACNSSCRTTSGPSSPTSSARSLASS
jgi:hypothetical protein